MTQPAIDPEIKPDDDFLRFARARMRAWGAFFLILLTCVVVAWALGVFRM